MLKMTRCIAPASNVLPSCQIQSAPKWLSGYTQNQMLSRHFLKRGQCFFRMLEVLKHLTTYDEVSAVLNSVPSAMNAYQTMMNEDSFSFEVTRRGQRMTLEYEIR